jgi:hypothetical protein
MFLQALPRDFHSRAALGKEVNALEAIFDDLPVFLSMPEIESSCSGSN